MRCGLPSICLCPASYTGAAQQRLPYLKLRDRGQRPFVPDLGLIYRKAFDRQKA